MPALSPQRGETVPDGLCGASREAVPPPQHRDKFHGSRAVRCLSEAVLLGNGSALPRVPAAEWGRCTMTFREMVKRPVGNSLLFSSFLCTAVRCPLQHAAMSRGARCDGQCTALRFLPGNGAVRWAASKDRRCCRLPGCFGACHLTALTLCHPWHAPWGASALNRGCRSGQRFALVRGAENGIGDGAMHRAVMPGAVSGRWLLWMREGPKRQDERPRGRSSYVMSLVL